LEHGPQGIRPASERAVGFAQQARAVSGGKIFALVAGENAQQCQSQIESWDIDGIYVADEAWFHTYRAETYTTLLAKVAQDCQAHIVAAASTPSSRDVLPRVTVRLDGAMASDVLKIVDEQRYVRPMWAGNILATVALHANTQVLTIRATEFPTATCGNGAKKVQKFSCKEADSLQKTQFLSLKPITSSRPDLSTARRVVSGGRAVKSAEGFKIVEQLADALGAAVGASRAVCDAGWAPNDLQVGQTGKVVAPELYIALGISGAIQHLAGMKGAKVIVAINKDPDAPIFQIADYSLVEDIFTAVPELIRLLG
jgi:electron transfer flavoprotein alpha subunit